MKTSKTTPLPQAREKRRATTADLDGAGDGEAGRGVAVGGEEGYLGFGCGGLGFGSRGSSVSVLRV
jgi:hypothetical protein